MERAKKGKRKDEGGKDMRLEREAKEVHLVGDGLKEILVGGKGPEERKGRLGELRHSPPPFFFLSSKIKKEVCSLRQKEIRLSTKNEESFSRDIAHL